MDNESLTPVAVFAYNRPEKIRSCIEALEKCTKSCCTDLFLFCDGRKGDSDKDSVNAVQDWARSYQKEEHVFSSVHVNLKDKNIGLANSIVSGVTELIEKYGKVIVVEDDLIVEHSFLEYMNNALAFYESNEKIWAIASYGYNLKSLKKYKHDVYMGYRASSWGWATWKDRWQTVDWSVSDYHELETSKEKQKLFCRGGGDLYPMLQRQMRGESDSWAIRWNYAASKQDKLTVYPKYGLVSNYGFDGTGTHSGLNAPKSIVSENSGIVFENLNLDRKITREFYLMHTDTLYKKIKRNLSIKDIRKLLKRIMREK